jgi:hypothetical protein
VKDFRTYQCPCCAGRKYVGGERCGWCDGTGLVEDGGPSPALGVTYPIPSGYYGPGGYRMVLNLNPNKETK